MIGAPPECVIEGLGVIVGAPLANASEGAVGGDYCGDLCRTAIMGLVLLGRRDRPAVGGDAERASWTRAWAVATLVLGLLASAVWWRIILSGS